MFGSTKRQNYSAQQPSAAGLLRVCLKTVHEQVFEA